MADYQETTLSGTAYTRASQVVIANPLNGVKAVSFMEEQVVNLCDEPVQQPGARVVPDDELMIPWSAANG